MIEDDLSQNKARIPGVVISASKAHPTGNGARDPAVLLNDRTQYLDGQPHAAFDQRLTFDSYDGQNETDEPDWYRLDFPEPVTINCIEMTMGFAYIDGGWWKSLAVEVLSESSQQWQQVENLRIVPPYDFRDTGAGRKPFETHALLFKDAHARSFRVIGQPGGLAQLTSLARIGAYHRDLSVWNPSFLPEPPTPRLFKLIDPNTLWDMSESFVKLTGLGLDIFHLASYLDETRYQAYWRTVSHQYVERTRHLWRLIGDTIGWPEWANLEQSTRQRVSTTPSGAYVREMLEGTLCTAVAPVVVAGQLLGELFFDPVILDSNLLDYPWHQNNADQLGIAWADYQAALNRTPRMTLGQLEGLAELFGIVTNSIANLSYDRQSLRGNANGTVRSQRKAIVHRAIEFMRDKLEDDFTVADVAYVVSISPTYFCRLFTEETGRNPRDYLIDLRIARAKEFLQHTDMSVVDVCTILNYHPVYFSRLFKEKTGVSPSDFARQMRRK